MTAHWLPLPAARWLLLRGMLALAIPIVARAQTAEATAAASTADFYVATDGNDLWQGRLPAAAARDGADGPFATLDRARRAVRELKTAQPGRNKPITVLVRGGLYSLDEAITFEPADSGTAEAPIIYAAYPGEDPVLSGAPCSRAGDTSPIIGGRRSCQRSRRGNGASSNFT